MNEVETLRNAARIMKREGEPGRASGVKEVAWRIEQRTKPDPDEALALALQEANRVSPHEAGTVAWFDFLARAAREHMTGHPTPDREPEWSPTPGQWATILPGADRGGVPEGVDRVLVTAYGTYGGPYVDVAWEGEGRWGDRADACLPATSLGLVRPRVFEPDDEVPNHLVVRDPKGMMWSGCEANTGECAAPGNLVEVLEGER